MRAKFWWGTIDKGKKIHWKAWEYLQNPKMDWGMGFRNLILFNKVLLEATTGNNLSYIWHSIKWSKEVLYPVIMWKVGNGESITACRDAWIPNLPTGKITSHVPYESNMKVENLITDRFRWDTRKLQNLFLPYEVDAIARVPILGDNYHDARYWRFEKRGSYLVKTGYWTSFKYNPNSFSIAAEGIEFSTKPLF